MQTSAAESLTVRRSIAAAVRAADAGAVALVDGATTVTYGGLCHRIDERIDELDLVDRSLVVLSGGNHLEFVVTYLALVDAGHVPLLAGSHVERLAAAWRPDAVVHAEPDGIAMSRRPAADRVLHPDLALLLSTSGSTGSPKLVRLSTQNVTSNACAIAEYLGLGPADRAITSLPLHYCYGLSVLHSHLAVGASIVLTEASVVDPCFVAAMRDHGVTNVAGVPHTFELLDHAGPARIHVPTLRFVTQAGGRLPADRVRQWLDRAEAWGVDFFVMYGQTEATARIAYLPPHIARRRPSAIGVPIPGGSLELDPVQGADPGVGELVYRGANVMLGYATSQSDLGLGATLDELRTGDLGRYHADDGVFEVVGRRSRFVKPFGVRVDLDIVERELARLHPDVAVAGDDERLVVVAPGADAAEVRSVVAQLTELPLARVVVDVEAPIPRTASDKVDYAALLRNGGDEPTPVRTDSVAAMRDHGVTNVAGV
ncbi:MAG TPA: AMP-binding protein, partial [Ilumatobacteraceae bacterium]